MDFSTRLIVFVVAFLCLSMTAQSDPFPSGSITQISLPFNGQVLGLNDSDEFVGSYTDSGGNLHGFVDNHGVFTTIDVPGSTYTQIYAISNSGELAGFYGTTGVFPNEAFSYANGVFTTVVTNAQPGLSGVAINDAGAVVGTFASCITDYCGAGFEYLNGQLATAHLSPLPSQPYTITLSGINDRGVIVGGYGFDPFGQSSYPMVCSLVPNTVNVSCTAISYVPGVPTGINNLDEIIGNDFLYDGGATYQLPYDPTGINNLGQIVLGGDYLFTPSTPPSVPEPATSLMLGLGLAGIAIALVRRKRDTGSSQ